MAVEAKPEKLTVWEAIKDLGWFPVLFAVAVGGPSILAILEEVFVNHQLVPALQWIVDGYNRVMAVLGAVVEPLVQPAIDWVNSRLGWSLDLNPVWRPVFALCMMFVTADVRAWVRDGHVAGALRNGGLFGIAFLAAALLIGLFAAGPGWLAQGAVAALPLAMFGLITAAFSAIGDNWSLARVPVTVSAGLAIGCFFIGAGLSLGPGLAQCAGLITLGGVIALIGVYSIWNGLSGGHHSDTRGGLTILGGFVAAGMILAADFGLKALGVG